MFFETIDPHKRLKKRRSSNKPIRTSKRKDVFTILVLAKYKNFLDNNSDKNLSIFLHPSKLLKCNNLES